MPRNTLIAIVALVILLVLAIVVLTRPDTTETTTTPTATVTATATSTATTSPSTTASASPSSTATPVTTTVTYNGTSYSPATITVKQGDTVVFRNEGSGQMWPASDPHPTHTTYSAFDSKKAIAAGSTYSFTFDRVGSWGFHDHLTPSAKGTVVVQ